MNKKVIEKILNEKITNWLELGSGMSNTVYRASTQKNTYGIKMLKAKSEVTESNTLFVEAKIIQELNYKNPLLPIPKVVYLDLKGKFYIYEFVKGVSVGEGNNNRYVNTLLPAMGKFHCNINCLDKHTVCNSIGIKEYSLDDFFLKYGSNLREYANNIVLPSDYRLVLQTALEVLKKTGNNNIQEQLLHNDIHGENILLDKNGKLDTVIDFGDAIWGDVHLDMTWYVHSYPNDWQKVVDSYEKTSGFKIDKSKLIALACIRYAKVLCEWYLEGVELEHCNEKFSDYKMLIEKYCEVI